MRESESERARSGNKRIAFVSFLLCVGHVSVWGCVCVCFGVGRCHQCPRSVVVVVVDDEEAATSSGTRFGGKKRKSINFIQGYSLRPKTAAVRNKFRQTNRETTPNTAHNTSRKRTILLFRRWRVVLSEPKVGQQASQCITSSERTNRTSRDQLLYFRPF